MNDNQTTTWHYVIDIHQPDDMFLTWGKRWIPKNIKNWVEDPFGDIHYIGINCLKMGK